MSPAAAEKAIDFCVGYFSLFLDERSIFSIWRELVQTYGVLGKNAHDARLVAAMKRHDLTHILTFNAADFRRYPGVELLDPQIIAAN